MALIDCPDCATPVSDKAVACPKCACPIAVRIPIQLDQSRSIGDSSVPSTPSIHSQIVTSLALGPETQAIAKPTPPTFPAPQKRGVTVHVSFKKRQVPGISGYGQWRSQGTLTFTADGITVSGKHVKTLGTRWGIGIAISLGILILTLGAFAPGILLIYPLVEYVILDSETLQVPWDQVQKWSINGQNAGIAIGQVPFKAPVVFVTMELEKVKEALAEFAQGKGTIS